MSFSFLLARQWGTEIGQMEKQKLAIPSCLHEEEKGPEPTTLWWGPLGCLGGQCDFIGEKAQYVRLYQLFTPPVERERRSSLPSVFKESVAVYFRVPLG